jgi:phage regulator Rha-like protein
MFEKISKISEDYSNMEFMFKSMKETFQNQIDNCNMRHEMLEDSHEKLSEFAHLPTDFYERLEQSTDMLQNRLKKEIGKILKMVMESVFKTENLALESKYICDRIDRMYLRIKEDVGRHETLCFEIADKFEKQHDVLMQLIENAEDFKTYALLTDVHMEAF